MNLNEPFMITHSHRHRSSFHGGGFQGFKLIPTQIQSLFHPHTESDRGVKAALPALTSDEGDYSGGKELNKQRMKGFTQKRYL